MSTTHDPNFIFFLIFFQTDQTLSRTISISLVGGVGVIQHTLSAQFEDIFLFFSYSSNCDLLITSNPDFSISSGDAVEGLAFPSNSTSSL